MENWFTSILTALKDNAGGLIALVGVWLGWRLGLSSQRTQRRLDRLARRFDTHTEVMRIVDNIPQNLSPQELLAKVGEDKDFKGQLTSRILRLLGLRNELIASLDPELIRFIDDKFRPLFSSGVGSWSLVAQDVQFVEVLNQLRPPVLRIETKLLAEQEKLSK